MTQEMESLFHCPKYNGWTFGANFCRWCGVPVDGKTMILVPLVGNINSANTIRQIVAQDNSGVAAETALTEDELFEIEYNKLVKEEKDEAIRAYMRQREIDREAYLEKTKRTTPSQTGKTTNGRSIPSPFDQGICNDCGLKVDSVTGRCGCRPGG